MKVNKIYQTLGDDVGGRIIAPAIQEYLKKSTAMFTAEELISKREIGQGGVQEVADHRAVREQRDRGQRVHNQL